MELYLWLSYTRYGFEWLARPMVLALIALLIVSIVYPIVVGRRQKTAPDESLAKA